MATFLVRTINPDGTVSLAEREGTAYEAVNLNNIPTDNTTRWLQLGVAVGLGFLLGGR